MADRISNDHDSQDEDIVEGEKGTNSEKEEPKEDDAKEEEEEIEIPVRNSVAQHIIARKNEKIKKLQEKIENKEENEDFVPPGDEEDSGLSTEAEKALERALDKKIAPFVGKLKEQAEEKELESFLTEEPEAKKYEKHIRAYMQHDAYKNVAPSVIYHHLAFTNALAMGAKKKNAADLGAKMNKGGGRTFIPKDTSPNGLPSVEEIADMSEAEFEKLEAEARQGKFSR